MIFKEVDFPLDYDPASHPSFKYLQEFTLTPSESVTRLLRAMNPREMEFFTHEAFESKDFRQEPFKIHTVKIIGDAYTILRNLEVIRPTITAYIDYYLESEESLVNKKYELQQSLYLIKEFLYLRNVKKTMYYDYKNNYKVNFDIGELKTASLPASSLTFSDKADQEFEDHHRLRQEFLEMLYDYIDLSIEKIKVLETKVELDPKNNKNEGRERKLLEVWLALSQAGFIDHISKKEHAKYRSQFFEIFNLTDLNYNDHNSNWKKNPKKGEFLESLLNTIRKNAIEQRLKSQNNKKQ